MMNEKYTTFKCDNKNYKKVNPFEYNFSIDDVLLICDLKEIRAVI
jgi:hypothetical protein